MGTTFRFPSFPRKRESRARDLGTFFNGLLPRWNENSAKEPRDEGIPAETHLGARKASMKHQMSYANSKEIPVAVIFGSNEIESNQASIKDLSVGKEERGDIGDHKQYRKAGRVGQVTVGRVEMARTAREMLEA